MKPRISQESISEEVDSWIAEQDLPVRSTLRFLRKEGFNIDDDGVDWGFVSWFLRQPWSALDCVPVRKEAHFCVADFDESGNDVSAFNTVDFVRESGYEFDLEAWRLRQVLEKVVQIAITHSVVGDAEAKERCRVRYVGLVEDEFRDRAFEIKRKLEGAKDGERKTGLMEQLRDLNYCLRRCRQAWKRYAGCDDAVGDG